ncbi:MAG: hypothetical protein ACJ75Z_08015 [Solirubrobacterales bacterium]
MPIKARTTQTYLAGIGASGALMAGAFVTFVILVGVVTFDAWPRPGGLFEGTDGQVSVAAPVSSNVAAPQANATTVNTAGLVAPSGPVGSSASRRAHKRAPNSSGSLSGGTQPPGSGGQGPVTSPTPAPPEPPPSNVVSRTVSTAGTAAEGTTNFVGDALGGNSSPGPGGLVGDLGRSLNGTVQGLAGTVGNAGNPSHGG